MKGNTMTNLTLEERERMAYIEGRTDEAAVLALAIDCVDDELDELRHEVDSFKSELDRAEEKIAELEDELERVVSA